VPRPSTMKTPPVDPDVADACRRAAVAPLSRSHGKHAAVDASRGLGLSRRLYVRSRHHRPAPASSTAWSVITIRVSRRPRSSKTDGGPDGQPVD